MNGADQWIKRVDQSKFMKQFTSFFLLLVLVEARFAGSGGCALEQFRVRAGVAELHGLFTLCQRAEASALHRLHAVLLEAGVAARRALACALGVHGAARAVLAAGREAGTTAQENLGQVGGRFNGGVHQRLRCIRVRDIGHPVRVERLQVGVVLTQRAVLARDAVVRAGAGMSNVAAAGKAAGGARRIAHDVAELRRVS